MIGLAALILAAWFAGAAFYINYAEHPARMLLPVAQARDQWEPAYKRGYAMQATLAVLSGIAGLIVWWRWGIAWQLAGSVLMLANWPWTLLVIKPVNRKLIANSADDEAVRGLLSRWSKLHAVRTAMGLAATFCFAIPYIWP